MRVDQVYARYMQFCSKLGTEPAPKFTFRDFVKKQYCCRSNGHYLEGAFFLAPKFTAEIERGEAYEELEPKNPCDKCKIEDITTLYEGKRLCEKCLSDVLE